MRCAPPQPAGHRDVGLRDVDLTDIESRFVFVMGGEAEIAAADRHTLSGEARMTREIVDLQGRLQPEEAALEPPGPRQVGPRPQPGQGVPGQQRPLPLLQVGQLRVVGLQPGAADLEGAILEVVSRAVPPVGRGRCAEILRGRRSKAIVQHSYDGLPNYGAYRDLRGDDVLAVIDALLESGRLRATAARFPKLEVVQIRPFTQMEAA